jgi:hypothetical protein
LGAFYHLVYYDEGGGPRRVNYAALDVEELGSVYESLLDNRPVIGSDGFDFAAGTERKATGSYYTPPELVAELIKSALEPVLADRLAGARTPAERARAILSIKVVDPAAGSGHFLLAAARRLGKELARVRTGEEEPSPEAQREAVRDVITHCIYGVDKNPLAVELCKVALWLEGQAAGKPLTFLDHRIRCGDSLLGVFDLEALQEGIPDEAYEPAGVDDRRVARAAKLRNAAERTGRLFHVSFTEAVSRIAGVLMELEDVPEDTFESIRHKVETCERVETSTEFSRLRLACDIWTAAFLQPYGRSLPGPITTQVLHDAVARGAILDGQVGSFVLTRSVDNHFFHWPLAFPEVFARGGFDVVVGNPPFMGGLKISGALGDRYRH